VSASSRGSSGGNGGGGNGGGGNGSDELLSSDEELAVDVERPRVDATERESNFLSVLLFLRVAPEDTPATPTDEVDDELFVSLFRFRGSSSSATVGSD
jgi:hypothetical protein